jgi:hypothetical protein
LQSAVLGQVLHRLPLGPEPPCSKRLFGQAELDFIDCSGQTMVFLTDICNILRNLDHCRDSKHPHRESCQILSIAVGCFG